MVQILPNIIAKVFSRDVLKPWFHLAALDMLEDIVFNEDVAGNWDGTWTTPNDLVMQDLLKEDKGVDIEFDTGAIEELEKSSAKKHRSQKTEDQSHVSFGTQFGKNNPDENSDNQTAASASPSVDPAAAASGSPAV